MRHPTRWMLFCAGLVPAGAAQAEWTVNMTPGVTTVSHTVFNLHMTIFWICAVIGLLVFGAMFWSMLMHRKSSGQKAAQFHESTAVEILWTLIPFLILIVIAVPATKALIDIYDTSDSDVDIQVTGYQWKWHYKYLGQDVEFFSNLATPAAQIQNQAPKDEHYLLEVDNPLVVPAGAKVRLLVTAADVIHSWWVPALAVKKDAIPGFVNEAWTRIDQPGLYRGQCAELCGKDHGFMPIVVEVKSAEDYAIWMAARKEEAAKLKELTSKEWTLDELIERGDKVYHTYCTACHQSEGQGLPPLFPALKGSAVVKGPIDAHFDTVFHGKPGTAMAAFGKQLSEVDIAAVITYERNAWGNKSGDMLTPKDVLQRKQAGGQ